MTDTPNQAPLTFASLKPEPGMTTGRPVTQLNGQPWEMTFWDSPGLRHLSRAVPGGTAQLKEWRDGRFGLEVVHPELTRVGERHRNQTFDTLVAAAEAAERFEWQTREHAGLIWYAIDADSRQWVAVLSDADHAVVHQFDDGRDSMKRWLSPRAGETYEISASRFKSADGDLSVQTFAEAAAIALTLPTFVGMLGGAWPTNARS